MSLDPRIQGAQTADRMMADALAPVVSEAERTMAIKGLPDDERAWVEGFHKRTTRVVERLRAGSRGEGGVPLE